HSPSLTPFRARSRTGNDPLARSSRPNSTKIPRPPNYLHVPFPGPSFVEANAPSRCLFRHARTCGLPPKLVIAGVAHVARIGILPATRIEQDVQAKNRAATNRCVVVRGPHGCV